MAKAPPVRIKKEALHTLVHDIFVAADATSEHAHTIADVLTWADQRGIGSHGVSRIPRYMELFTSGEAKARPKLRIDRPRPATVIVDADGAPGPVALTAAMKEAIATARQTGIAWASVRGTVHTGAIGYYTSLAAEQGMAAVGLVAGVPNMAYFGSRGEAVATSPLSIAVPAARHANPVLDMATATIALGKIAQYKIAGKPLPEGAAMTAEGELTTDPSLAEIPMPMAGAKGAGMSLMFEFLTSVLVSNPIFAEYHSDKPGGQRHRQNASLIAIDVSAFAPLATFKENVDGTLSKLKELPRANGVEELLFPGERGARTYAERAAAGIPIPAATWEKLVKDATRLKVRIPDVAGS
jgi:LDH2 family malate/lactate/ureidoglycolate dehydrogenase